MLQQQSHHVLAPPSGRQVEREVLLVVGQVDEGALCEQLTSYSEQVLTDGVVDRGITPGVKTVHIGLKGQQFTDDVGVPLFNGQV